ncbi:PTS sugar transporter subunit IIA [Oceanispirochaeta sp.]|jgi:PTS system nitrogen regulatory IIA component|uniref:PTS sugar transporter subunit IIA n=1 Tax=Oceanispirochaeta sp. TaxID=2035350 RepID=UPI002635BAFD|nr:PTS sugar transporter subunit IIA [Oceanispirochaeta sp.]MDA3955260.1 PTS sugar transporter subunit IIA [Oceanispirochaeta sp.]
MGESVKETAQILNVSEETIHQWIKQSFIPVHNINDQYYFNRTEILEWATSQQIKVSSDIFMNDDKKNISLPSLTDTLREGGINYNINGNDPETVLRSIVNTLVLPRDVDREFLFQVLLTREKMGSTGIGDGIAIPHVRNPVVLHVTTPSVNLCFLKNPIDFHALDGKPVNIFFTLISPTIRAHLHILSRISFVLHDQNLKDALMRQAEPEEIFNLLSISEACIPKRRTGEMMVKP